MYHALFWQALGIPYVAKGASEPNAVFRKVLQANFCPEHMHRTMREQLSEDPCLCHPDARNCKIEACDLAVFGTPCPPFSSQRVKRFQDGSVAQHNLTSITTQDAMDMLCDVGHKAVIMEQVAGFDKAESAGGSADASPMRQLLVYVSPFHIAHVCAVL